MFIKLLLDPTLDSSLHNLQSNVAVWLVEEKKPLNDAENCRSLATALGLKGSVINAANYCFVTATNKCLDVRRTGIDNGLTKGMQLVLCNGDVFEAESAASNSQKNTPRTPRSSSPPVSPRGDDKVRAPSAAPLDDEESSQKADDDVEEEEYASLATGWMPFVIKSKQGKPSVTFIDPFTVLTEKDRTPVMQELCEQCAHSVSGADPLRVVVDRHYRPAIASTDVVEGWVEKLGGSTFPRWQKRYIVISEKSLDWFTDMPNTGEKKKITGHRLFVRDGKLLIDEISETPDHPKCKDEAFFHFSVSFKDVSLGDKVFYFRVSSSKERGAFVNYLRLCDSRLRSRSVSRNPVFWKRWVDAFLTNSADVGALHVSNVEAARRFEVEIESLEKKLAEIRKERPPIEAELQANAVVVQDLLREISCMEHQISLANNSVAQADESVQVQQRLLAEKQNQLGDELKKAVMLEQHTTDRKAELLRKRQDLKQEIMELERKHDDIFARWRKLEERLGGGIGDLNVAIAPGRIDSVLSSRSSFLAPPTPLSPPKVGNASFDMSSTRARSPNSSSMFTNESMSPSRRLTFSLSRKDNVSPSRVDLSAAVEAARAAMLSTTGRNPSTDRSRN